MIDKKMILDGLENNLSYFYSGKAYFSDDEISCPCGCGSKNTDKEAFKRLNVAKEYFGRPMNLNSAVRCKKHNSTLKDSSPTSSHIEYDNKPSFAYDIKVPNNQERFDIVEALIYAGFKRILIYKTFIHVDNDPKKIRTLKIM